MELSIMKALSGNLKNHSWITLWIRSPPCLDNRLGAHAAIFTGVK
jgi:hypothetical protein